MNTWSIEFIFNSTPMSFKKLIERRDELNLPGVTIRSNLPPEEEELYGYSYVAIYVTQDKPRSLQDSMVAALNKIEQLGLLGHVGEIQVFMSSEPDIDRFIAELNSEDE
jgi:hypothetical protein